MLPIYTSPAFLLHACGPPGHPERRERLDATLTRLGAEVPALVEWREPSLADAAYLSTLHDPAYVRAVLALDGHSARLDADTAVNPHSVRAAQLASGAARDVVDAIVSSANRRSMALVRPPGHHAERDRAMGFCLFGNVALAAAYAVDTLGVARVAIIDWDVHHGNGTQHLLEERADIFVANLHERGNFPGTGAAHERGRGAGVGTTLNVPLPSGAGDTAYLGALASEILPAVRAFRPELILVSAGFDAHELDPLGGMQVTTAGFAAMCTLVAGAADELCGGRLGLVLEGGYDLDGLASSIVACVRVLAGK